MSTMVVPHSPRLLLEDSSVRVYEFRLRPGEKALMRPQPGNIMYPVNDFRAMITWPDGKAEAVDFQAGQAGLGRRRLHQLQNIGSTEARAWFVEIK